MYRLRAREGGAYRQLFWAGESLYPLEWAKVRTLDILYLQRETGKQGNRETGKQGNRETGKQGNRETA